jgi:hypothetical protein
MIIFIRIEVHPSVDRPGIPIAQTLREITPTIEMAVPLQSGFYPDRFSGETKAEWTCESNATLKDLEAIKT